MSSWLNQDVAEAQAEWMRKELEHPEEVQPFVPFIEAMWSINQKDKKLSLLDVGCGAGAYAVLCKNHFPWIDYTGTDFSEEMIKCARETCPTAKFEVREFLENEWHKYQIILVSASMEYAGAFRALGPLLREFPDYLILHRLRVTGEKSHCFSERTYCGNVEDFFLWNMNELKDFIYPYAHIIKESYWDLDRQATLVLRSWKSYSETV